MKKILNWAIITTIAFAIVLVAYCVLNFSDCVNTASLFSALLGVISTIAFGMWVSYIFQRMNDKTIQKKNEELIETIREREFSKLRFHLASLVKNFHVHEDQLVEKFENINLKCSFSKEDIDIENLTINYFIFMSICKDIDKYVDNENDRVFVRTNIDCLFMKDLLSEMYFNGVETRISQTYYEFHKFNLICIELSEKMSQLNLDYKLQIFKPNEIKAVCEFSNDIGIGCFVNFNPPYEIIQLFEKLLAIQSFVKADFGLYYKTDSFCMDIIKQREKKNEFDNIVKNWKKEYSEKAEERLKIATQIQYNDSH